MVAARCKKAMVTGGAGFIGSHLVDALIERGYAVVVLDNLSSGNKKNLEKVAERLDFIQGDICNMADVEDACRGCDLVFHLAAVVSVTESMQRPRETALVNELGCLNVLEASRRQGVRRVVLSSSSAVYGEQPGLPKKETMPLGPISPYALHKLINEQYADLYFKLYGMETVSLRYFNVYGPRQDPSSPYSGVISIFLTRAINGVAPVIFGNGSQFRDFVYVRDVVAANLAAATAKDAPGKAINIGTGQAITILLLWQTIQHISGTVMEAVHEVPRQGDILESVADIDFAQSLLGYVPGYSFKMGIAETYDWYRHQ